MQEVVDSIVDIVVVVSVVLQVAVVVDVEIGVIVVVTWNVWTYGIMALNYP